MNSHVTDVQPMTHPDGGFCYGFGVQDDRGGTAAVYVGFKTEEETEEAHERIGAILARAAFVMRPGT
jgi:hypothetical protein